MDRLIITVLQELSLIDLHCIGLLFAKGVLALHVCSDKSQIPLACCIFDPAFHFWRLRGKDFTKATARVLYGIEGQGFGASGHEFE